MIEIILYTAGSFLLVALAIGIIGVACVDSQGGDDDE
jgi:hypothetical protein